MHLYNAVQCIGNTLIIISARLISYGHINDMTPATMQNCSAGSVQMSSDPRSSQGLRFLPKIQRWHQKLAFWHCFIRINMVRGLMCFPSWCGQQAVSTQMYTATAATLRNKKFQHLSRAKRGQCLILFQSDQILKHQEMPGAMSHSACTVSML